MFNKILFTLLTRAQEDLGKLGTQIRFNYLLFTAVLLLSAASFWLSYEMRFDFSVPGPWVIQRWLVLPYATFLESSYILCSSGTFSELAVRRVKGHSDTPAPLRHLRLCIVSHAAFHQHRRCPTWCNSDRFLDECFSHRRYARWATIYS